MINQVSVLFFLKNNEILHVSCEIMLIGINVLLKMCAFPETLGSLKIFIVLNNCLIECYDDTWL